MTIVRHLFGHFGATMELAKLAEGCFWERMASICSATFGSLFLVLAHTHTTHVWWWALWNLASHSEQLLLAGASEGLSHRRPGLHSEQLRRAGASEGLSHRRPGRQARTRGNGCPAPTVTNTGRDTRILGELARRSRAAMRPSHSCKTDTWNPPEDQEQTTQRKRRLVTTRKTHHTAPTQGNATELSPPKHHYTCMADETC